MKNHTIIKTTQKQMMEMAANWISINEPRIIEVGCSSGSFTDFIKKRGIPNYIGLDIDDFVIDRAREAYPEYKFMVADINENYYLLRKASMIVLFQTLQCIRHDLRLLNNIIPSTKMIISVPNSPYGGNLRHYELSDWKKRFSRYIDFSKFVTIQNPKKVDKRSFLFKGVRNEYIDKKNLAEFPHVTFDGLIIGGGS